MQVRIETELPVAPDVYWQRLFFDVAFNEGLHRELGFAYYAVVEERTRPDGVVERVLETEPPISGSEAIQKYVGGAMRIIEHGQFDPHSQRYGFRHAPKSGVGASRTRITGTIHVEPRPGGLVHVVQAEVAVSAFGLGALIERTIEKTMRESYATMQRYARAFIAEHGL